MNVWDTPYRAHRGPLITDLRADPFEHASMRTVPVTGMFYDQWRFRRSYLLVPASALVAEFMKSFEEFPPRSAPASFSIGDALKSLQTASQGH